VDALSPNAKGIPLGPFVLQHVIGRGGMGEVWRGMHVEQQVPVAIKVLTAVGTADPVFASCFQNEVLAATTLDHPTIVQVFDQGKLPGLVEEETDGALVSGSPYLAMELAIGGSLRGYRAQLEWSEIWRILIRLLEGLAHAHARGVIHRDLKPSNVLLSQKTGGLKLTDFGLAAAMEGEDRLDGQIIGTPDYMAPEQIQGHFRDIGPWTDLYALGCLAVALSTGRPPFYSDSPFETMEAHIREKPKTFVHQCEVPSGFDEWIGTLLEKSPYLRFHRAADAKIGLLKLIEEDTQQSRVELDPTRFQDDSQRNGSPNSPGLESDTRDDKEITKTYILEEGLRPGERKHQNPSPLPEIKPELVIGINRPKPPIPREHYIAENHVRQPPLLGTGLGLFGLRFLPLVGRETEQSALWAAMHKMLDARRALAIHITGAEGSGKSRLADWLGGRAHESGAATILKAQFGANESAPFANMWSRFLRCDGLNRQETFERIYRHNRTIGWDSKSDSKACTELLGPFPETLRSGPWVHFGSNKERFVLLQHCLEAQCRLRPVILIMDDASQSEDALDFTKHLLDAQEESPHPILLVLTSSPATTPDEYLDVIDNIQARRDVQTIDVEPLPHHDRHRLVREMLGLEDELAEMVERRTGGNPHFAVQLVGEWVERNLLTQGEHGFKLRTGKFPAMPGNLSAVWEGRLQRALDGIPDTTSLEMAAVLGIEVNPSEWIESCESMDLKISMEGRDQLLQNHLAVLERRTGHWRFAHSLVAESLIKNAAKSKRLAKLHIAAAEMLRNKTEVPHARLGRHLFAAARLEDAAQHLLMGANQAHASVRHNKAWTLITKREECLLRLGIPLTDKRWVDNWLVKGRIRKSQARSSAARKFFYKVLDFAGDDPEGKTLKAWAYRYLGELSRVEGNNDRGMFLHKKALEYAPNNSTVQARTLASLGYLNSSRGNLEEGQELLEKAEKIAIGTEDQEVILEVRLLISALYQLTGKRNEAKTILLHIRSVFMKEGRSYLLARCANDLGEIERHSGNIEEAEEYYKEALESFDSVGSETAWIPRANLGILLAEQGRCIEAREHLERVQRRMKRLGQTALLGTMHVVLMLVATHERNWTAWDNHFDEGVRLIASAGLIDRDVAREAQLAGVLCIAAGENTRALRALNLALDHYERMDRSEDAAIVSDLISEITDD